MKELQRVHDFAARLGGRRLEILRNALATFSENRASQAAAALAYYAFFSLFPLLLMIIAGGSYLVDVQQLYRAVLKLVQTAIPISNQLIEENLRRVVEARRAVGIVGLLTLLWSASGFFTSLAYNINLAWPRAKQRSFLKKRLIGLAMIGCLTALLILSLVLDWVTTLIPILRAGLGARPEDGPWNLISGLASWVVMLVLLLGLYRWIPAGDVPWRAASRGALTASIGLKAASAGFVWYLKSGLGRYQLVYGSLGAVVALLVLLYVVTLITLFGAHLTAAIEHGARRASWAS